MINERMRNISYAVLITLLMLSTVASTTIASTVNNDSEPILFSDLSEVSKKTNIGNETYFILLYGFIIANAVLQYQLPFNDSYMYIFTPVKKVTFIGIGAGYYSINGTIPPLRFYIKTFDNVSAFSLILSNDKFDTSHEYQLITSFVKPLNSGVLIFNLPIEKNRMNTMT
jgi:hypothetical protein